MGAIGAAFSEFLSPRDLDLVQRDQEVFQSAPVLRSRWVNVGQGKRFAAGVGPAEGGEASPRSYAEIFHYRLARPATSERGAADLQAAASAADLHFRMTFFDSFFDYFSILHFFA